MSRAGLGVEKLSALPSPLPPTPHRPDSDPRHVASSQQPSLGWPGPSWVAMSGCRPSPRHKQAAQPEITVPTTLSLRNPLPVVTDPPWLPVPALHPGPRWGRGLTAFTLRSPPAQWNSGPAVSTGLTGSPPATWLGHGGAACLPLAWGGQGAPRADPGLVCPPEGKQTASSTGLFWTAAGGSKEAIPALPWEGVWGPPGPSCQGRNHLRAVPILQIGKQARDRCPAQPRPRSQ